MEKTVGVHRDKLLPDFAAEAFDAWAEKNGYVQPEPGGEAVLFQTCFVQHNEPELGTDTLYVLRKNGVDVRVVKGLALLRDAGLGARRPRGAPAPGAATTSTSSCPFVEKGAKVLVVNPTCSMMMRREWPHLLEGEDRARAERLAPAVMDVSEFLWSIRNEPRFSTRLQVVAARRQGRLPRALPPARAGGRASRGATSSARSPGVTVAATVMECCGHDGTFAMTVEGFEPSRRASARRPSTG